MDGIIEMDGRIIVMTTNCKSKIDKALLRPGRIDLDLELCTPSLSLVCEIFFYMYQEHDQNELETFWNLFEDRIKGNLLSTAKIMNCFMYMDPFVGLEYLYASQNSGHASGLQKPGNVSELIEIDSTSLVEISRDRVHERISKNLHTSEQSLEPIDFSTKVVNVYDLITVKEKHLDFRTSKSFATYGLNINMGQNLLSPLENGSKVFRLPAPTTDPVEFVYTFKDFKLALTVFGIVSYNLRVSHWKVYGSTAHKDADPVWEKVGEKSEDNPFAAQDLQFEPKAYFTAIKMVILKTQLLEFINPDMCKTHLYGFYKDM